MRVLIFLLILEVISGIGMAGELVIEREKVEGKVNFGEPKKVEGTEFYEATFQLPRYYDFSAVDDHAEDPFGGGGEPEQYVFGPTGVLELVGVPFPNGASATYVPETGRLIVRNTMSNLDLIAVYANSISGTDRKVNLRIRTEIYVVSGLQSLQLQESAEAEMDHKPERDAVLRAVKEGDARLVATHSLVSIFGQRSKVADVASLMRPEMVEGEGVEPRETLVNHSYGTILEAEPNLDADGKTIRLNIALEHHTAEPEFASVAGEKDLPIFHRKSISTNIVLGGGEYVLLGVWKPTGKAEYAEGDVMQVVFVTASLQGWE